MRQGTPWVAVRVGCVLVLGLGLAAGRAEAGSTDAVTYTVTVTKIEMSKDSGSTYTTVFEGSQAIDIASVNAGATAAALVAGATLDAGVYDVVRTTVDSTLSTKGFVNDGGLTYYTNGGSDATSTSSVAGNDPPSSGYTESTYTIPSPVLTDTGLTLTVTPGVAMTVTVSFDVSGVFSLTGSVISPSEPNVAIASK